MKLRELAPVLRSSRGDIQFAIVYDVDANRDLATGSVEYAVKEYGDWYLDRITGTAVDDDVPGALVLHVRKGE
jgi:hypothetical protein